MEKIIVETRGERLDKYVVEKTDLSRVNIQRLIKDEKILVNGEPSKANYKVVEGDEILVGEIVKTIQDISQLTLKSNEISSFLSEANLDGGNKPFSILEFAKNLVTKQEEQPQTENSQIVDPNPLAKKLKQQQKRLISSIVQNYIKSGKLLTILEKNLISQVG